MTYSTKSTFCIIALSLVLTGCSSNSFSDEPELTPPGNGKTLLIKLSANSFTRADTETEDNINTLHIAFFKSGDKPLFLHLTQATKNTDNNYYSVSLPASLQTIPDMMVAYANLSDDDKESMEAVFTSNPTIEKLQDTGNNLIMSTSAYFKSDKSYINYTPLSDSDYDSSTAVTINLDRVAAKITVKSSDNPTLSTLETVTADGSTRELSLEITGWGLNAFDNSSYIIKNADSYETFSEFIGTETWNKESDKTFSWAKSVNYSILTEDTELSLISSAEVTNELGSHVYTHESTRTNDDIEFTNSKPSVILCGQYKLGNDNIGTFIAYAPPAKT